MYLMAYKTVFFQSKLKCSRFPFAVISNDSVPLHLHRLSACLAGFLEE